MSVLAAVFITAGVTCIVTAGVTYFLAYREGTADGFRDALHTVANGGMYTDEGNEPEHAAWCGTEFDSDCDCYG